MSSAVQVSIHPSQFPDAVRRELLVSLRSRRINHKFHYDSYKQTRKWLALHEVFSPWRTDPECARAYEDSFHEAARVLKAREVNVVGLGCGGGRKDTRLLQTLRGAGKAPDYCPCDVATPMVLVALQTATAALPGLRSFPVVCDLAMTEDLPQILKELLPAAPRLYTFFGMLPNFEPELSFCRLAALMQPGDLLLLSANLAPGPDYNEGLRRILPLYDNDLTRDWLMTFLFELGVEHRDGSLRFVVEEEPAGSGLKRVAAWFHFEQAREIKLEQETVGFNPGERIRLFFSYRHTPQLVRDCLAKHALTVQDEWITPAGDEGVFLVTR